MNENRKHVLLVTNALTTPEIEEVTASISQMSASGTAVKVSLLYVKPYFPTCYFHIPSMIALAEDFEEEAKSTLETLGKRLNLDSDNQWIATGRVKPETLKLAATLGADFILTSSSIHRELSQSFSMKGSNYTLPIRTIESLDSKIV